MCSRSAVSRDQEYNLKTAQKHLEHCEANALEQKAVQGLEPSRVAMVNACAEFVWHSSKTRKAVGRVEPLQCVINGLKASPEFGRAVTDYASQTEMAVLHSKQTRDRKAKQ